MRCMRTRGCTRTAKSERRAFKEGKGAACQIDERATTVAVPPEDVGRKEKGRGRADLPRLLVPGADVVDDEATVWPLSEGEPGRW
jgi:hypothetical protein